jgi:hypothetical protein
MTILAAVAFFALKTALYAVWCAVGLRWVRGVSPDVKSSLQLAAARVLLGLAAGSTFVAVLSVVAPQQNRLGTSLPLLAGGFVILRWLEWAAIGVVVAERRWKTAALFAGRGRQQLWSAGGVLVSFASDAGTLLGVGALGLIPC